MKELIAMWKNVKMVILCALCAALYAAILIPFKAITIIPGVTEFRPACVMPSIFGILFGPAGAWGTAIGNFIGDLLGGTFGINCIFGFLGNLLLAYIPYKMWNKFIPLDVNDENLYKMNSIKKVITYIMGVVLGAMACAMCIGWGQEIFNILPFVPITSIIIVNDTIPPIILGPFLLNILYPRVQKWSLLWLDVMELKLRPWSLRNTISAVITAIGIVGGCILGMLIGITQYNQKVFVSGFSEGVKGSTIIILTVGIGILLIFVGQFILKDTELNKREE